MYTYVQIRTARRIPHCLAICGFALSSGCISSLTGAASAQSQNEPTIFISSQTVEYSPDATPELIGGHSVDPSKFPASFHSEHATGFCTAAVIGPNVLLSAAHCVNGSNLVLLTLPNGKSVSGTCDRAPVGLGSIRPDVALCLLGERISVIYESVDLIGETLHLHDPVLLTGFGCTEGDLVSGSDGIYRAGTTYVYKLPQAPFFTLTTKTGAALCPGDSGGPAFVNVSPDYQDRKLISVNSSVKTVVLPNHKVAVDPARISQLASLASPATRRFFLDWSIAHSVAICGVTENMQGCR